MSESEHRFQGGCHCGAVRFEVRPATLRASECNCSMCTMKGFVHVIVPPERFTLLQGADSLTEYRFNTRVAVHRFCKTCGVHPFYTPRSHPDQIDVNARCLDGDVWRRFEPTQFDGRNWEAARSSFDA